MFRLEGKLLYLTVLLTVINLLSVHGCKCTRQHSSQEKYCRSDFAILAKVTRRTYSLSRGATRIIYSVDIHKFYKGGPVNRGSAEVLTPVSPLCSVNLNIDYIYLINGKYNGELVINSCDMIRVMPVRDESADFPTLTNSCGPWLTPQYPTLRFPFARSLVEKDKPFLLNSIEN